ncbi:MAG: DUF3524 domain-containing protein [Proteobacteria bacterium]|nr:DUF3524 domain-containing protein [Pseudomonadota bacterium]
MPRHVLLLSPYDAVSHRYWRQGIVASLPEISFTVVTLPARYFAWRHRGNSLSLAFDERLAGRFDLVLATSMTDLSALKGLAPHLATVPSVLYFHENQFAYPESVDGQGGLERRMTSIYSALAADRLVFNSDYNRRTFVDGAGSLLAKMPDHVPPGAMARISAGGTVMPVPLGKEVFAGQGRGPSGRAVDIVWNHRWEYDKGLDALGEVIRALLASDAPFTMHLVGQQFRTTPEVMDRNIAMLRESGHLGHCGFVADREDYLALLARCDVVLSTSQHEFQGLAVLEAVAAGCVPVVPDRLVYPELFDGRYLYGDVESAVALILDRALRPPDLTHLGWATQVDRWRALLMDG